jgi:hypothetical protein
MSKDPTRNLTAPILQRNADSRAQFRAATAKRLNREDRTPEGYSVRSPAARGSMMPGIVAQRNAPPQASAPRESEAAPTSAPTRERTARPAPLPPGVPKIARLLS